MSASRNSPKALAAAKRLAEDLRQVYWRMVEEYDDLESLRFARKRNCTSSQSTAWSSIAEEFLAQREMNRNATRQPKY